MKEKVLVTLTTPVSYASGGESVDGTDVALVGPTGKQRKLVSKAQGAIGDILLHAQSLNQGSKEAPEKGGDEPMDADAVKGMLLFGGDFLGKLDDAICSLLFAGGCLLGDEPVCLNAFILDGAPIEVYHQLRAEYIANFLLSSLTGTSGKKA